MSRKKKVVKPKRSRLKKVQQNKFSSQTLLVALVLVLLVTLFSLILYVGLDYTSGEKVAEEPKLNAGGMATLQIIEPSEQTNEKRDVVE